MFAVVYSLAFSPDGKVLASASLDGRVNLWNPATGQQVAALGDTRYFVLCLAFSPDGKTLASGGMEEKPWTSSTAVDTTGVLRLWDVPTGKCLATFRDLDNVIVAAAFSPDSTTLLASGGKDGTIRLWDIPPAKRAGK
jgi:WD40 repeat protein